MRPARGFSLIELTVVTGLIVLLAGLTLSAGLGVPIPFGDGDI